MNSASPAVSSAPFSSRPVQITGICGSFGASSSTLRALQLSLQAAQRAGAQTRLLSVQELRLPFAQSGYAPEEFPDVARLNDAVRGSDGLIWATPEYHGSFSGALKNALDLGYGEYDGKVVALLGTAGGSIGAINALSHLRGVARQLHCWVLPQQVSVAQTGRAFDDLGQLRDERLAAALETMSQELVRWARVHRAAAPSAE